MKTSIKMSGEERREAILKAVRVVFAEKGFEGTTTRELARTAGVSEALLFKHFPDKEALYVAMLDDFAKDNNQKEIGERLAALEPSTANLVLLVYALLARVIRRSRPESDEEAIRIRLLQRSMMGDGEFARLLLRRRFSSLFLPKMEACIEAAIAAGDARPGLTSSSLMVWFTHHLAAMMLLHLLPKKPIVDYGVSREQLVIEAVPFLLRGMGLTDAAIKKYYSPETLSRLVG
ncbi:MAG: helix-turn-helix domain-containing protein [Planctomycetota bacterium]